MIIRYFAPENHEVIYFEYRYGYITGMENTKLLVAKDLNLIVFVCVVMYRFI